MRPTSFLLALLLLPLPCAVGAQRREPATLEVQRFTLPAASAPGDSSWRDQPLVPVLASAILPGTGQVLQGNRRWVPYLALEVWAWIRFRDYRTNSDALAERYRDVAWRVARRVGVGERRDTIFEYYEALAHVRSSGAFDVSPLQPGVQPESEPSTFNGNLWLLARQLFFGGAEYGPGTPQYEAALSYYESRAIPDTYAWAWGSSDLEQKVFAKLISDSDEAYRNGTRMLGVILANHIVSAVDALVTGRLRAISQGRADLETELVPERDAARFDARLRVRF